MKVFNFGLLAAYMFGGAAAMFGMYVGGNHGPDAALRSMIMYLGLGAVTGLLHVVLTGGLDKKGRDE